MVGVTAVGELAVSVVAGLGEGVLGGGLSVGVADLVGGVAFGLPLPEKLPVCLVFFGS